MDQDKADSKSESDDVAPRRGPIPLAERRRMLRPALDRDVKPIVFKDWASI